MLGKCVELLVSLPGQAKGNIGEVTSDFLGFLTLEMADGSKLVCLNKDVRVCD